MERNGGIIICLRTDPLSIPPLHPPRLSRDGATGHFEQDVEQARPTDTSEEEMQLKLALQLSKQQADEEERLK